MNMLVVRIYEKIDERMNISRRGSLLTFSQTCEW